VTNYEFTLKLNREVTDDELDALYEAGCGDAGIETGPLGTLADFDREAPSLAHAIASAARDIDKVPGLRAVGVSCDNMVNLLGIAKRAGVSREAVRLWATGQRGPGAFPKPALITAGGEQMYDWLEVAPWISKHQAGEQHTQTTESLRRAIRDDLDRTVEDIQRTLERMRIVCTADRVLAARDALKSEPDDDVRQEFERLLAGA
jgi:hypothetical protein